MNVLSMFELEGEKAIVTGGGQGMGREMALGLAEAGQGINRSESRCKQI